MTLERYACDGKMYRYGENGVQQGEWVKADEANAEITYLKTLLDEARDLMSYIDWHRDIDAYERKTEWLKKYEELSIDAR